MSCRRCATWDVGGPRSDGMRFHNPRSKQPPVARRKPSEERGMGSAASLIKAYEEETNGPAEPRLYCRYRSKSCQDDAGQIRSGCDSIRLYAKEQNQQDLMESISTWKSVRSLRDWIGESESSIFFKDSLGIRSNVFKRSVFYS